jgi:DtxR family transcriptional regulator, Mn-dependent transcriptional regulator
MSRVRLPFPAICPLWGHFFSLIILEPDRKPIPVGGEVLSINESAEMYLETIHVLSLKGNLVRSIDIVNELEYSKPSVSVAMKNLRTNGYVEIDEDGYITLTIKGRKIAETMYERHVAISDWLIFLGVDKKTAVHDACKMEHVMSEKSFSAIKKHIENWKREANN